MQVYEWLNEIVGDFDYFVVLSETEVEDYGLEKSVTFINEEEKRYFYFVNTREKTVTPMPMLSLAFGGQYNAYLPYKESTITTININELKQKPYKPFWKGRIMRKFYGYEYSNIERLKPGNEKIQTLGDLYSVLRECWSKETAYPSCQADWVPNDPSYGQCAITAMLVYDMFGGTIHRIRVSGGGTHYFNKVQGHYIDLTREQFDLYNIPVSYEPNEQMERQYCGKNADTKRRYELLIKNIVHYLNS